MGHDPQQSRLDRAHRSGLEPAGDGDLGNLQCAAAGLRPARRRHRLATASSGCRSAAATSAASTARKCKGPLNGPKATGDHCPEGWTFYKYPGPGFAGIGDNSAESSYYSWVDQHNTFGLGDDVPMSTANLTDGLVASQGRQDGRRCGCRIRWASTPRASTAASTIRTPAGRAAACGHRAATARRGSTEGGKGMKPMAVHFQLRPDPLAH